MDVAERLFAEQGFEAVSVRAITAEGGTNLAAVNYHFGSKEALIAAVIARRVEPLNRRRLELLDSVGAGDAEGIAGAFLDPVIEAARDDARGGDGVFCKLMGRCVAARDDRVSELVMRQFPEVVGRFAAAVRGCVPGMSAGSAYLRVLFMAGAMAHSLFHHDKLKPLSGGCCEVPELAALRGELVAFLAAGMRSGGGGRDV